MLAVARVTLGLFFLQIEYYKTKFAFYCIILFIFKIKKYRQATWDYFRFVTLPSIAQSPNIVSTITLLICSDIIKKLLTPSSTYQKLERYIFQ